MEVLSMLVLALEAQGCESCLIGSINEAADNGEFSRVARAIEWAIYSTKC